MNWSAEDVSEYDIYTAVYSSNGALIGVKKNEMSGTITGANDDSSMKVMVWGKKNTMKPVCAPVKWGIIFCLCIRIFPQTARSA